MSHVHIPKPVLDVYHYCDYLDIQKYPYVFGGGHNPSFAPSGFPRAGYDCSSIVSVAFHHAKILYSNYPLDTWALEHWGLSGQGYWMTLWVRNSGGENHCVLEFPRFGKRWFEAGHTGTIDGWRSNYDITGFIPRRRK